MLQAVKIQTQIQSSLLHCGSTENLVSSHFGKVNRFRVEDHLTLEKSRLVFLSALSMRIWDDTYKMGWVETGFMRITTSAESTFEHLPAIIRTRYHQPSVGRRQEIEGRRNVKAVPC